MVRRDGWTLLAMARESALNVFRTSGRMSLIIFYAVVAGSGVVAYEAQRTAVFDQSLEAYRMAGRNIIVISSSDPDDTQFEIDRVSCEGLTDISGVVRAGVVLDLRSVNTVEYGANVPLHAVSASLMPELRSGQILAGSALAGPADPRRRISISGTVASVIRARAQPAGLDLDSSLVALVPPAVQFAPRCVVELDRFQNVATLLPLLESAIATRGRMPQLQEVLRLRQDPVAQFRASPERRALWMAGLVGALLAVVLTFAGSSESAAYRLSGTTSRSHLVILVLGQVLCSGVFMFAGTVALLLLGPRIATPAAQLLVTVQAGMLWVFAYAVGVFPLLFADPSSLAKDR